MFTDFTWMRMIPALGISISNKCPEAQQLGPEGDARKVGRKGGGQKQEDGESCPDSSTLHEKPQSC